MSGCNHLSVNRPGKFVKGQFKPKNWLNQGRVYSILASRIRSGPGLLVNLRCRSMSFHFKWERRDIHSQDRFKWMHRDIRGRNSFTGDAMLNLAISIRLLSVLMVLMVTIGCFRSAVGVNEVMCEC